jgi:hypothetical protein
VIDTPKLNAQDVRRVLTAIKTVSPTITKDLRTDLRSKLGPTAKQVTNDLGGASQPPLSGFGNNGATAWSGSRTTVSFTPGKSRKPGNSLVSIRVTPLGKRRGIFIAELAGSRSSGITSQGSNLITVLNSRKPMKGKGGRFIYNKFRELRPEVVRLATNILNDTFKKFEKEL